MCGAANRDLGHAIGVDVAERQRESGLVVGGTDELPGLLRPNRETQIDDAVGFAIPGIHPSQVAGRDHIDGPCLRCTGAVVQRNADEKLHVAVAVDVASLDGACADFVAGRLADEFPRPQVVTARIRRIDVVEIVHAVPVRIGVGVVADAVAIGVLALGGIVWEGVAIVADAIGICVRRLGRIVGEHIGVVAYPIAVGIRRLVGVVREGVRIVANPVSVAVSRFGGVERSPIDGVQHAIAVVVGIRIVSDTVRICVPPLVRIVRKRVHGIDEAVAVRVGVGVAEAGELEPNGVEAGTCIGPVGSRAVDTAWLGDAFSPDTLVPRG